MQIDKTLERYYILIHELYSNLMLYEIENLKNGVMKNVTFHEIHTIEIIGDLLEATMRELADRAKVKQSTMTVMIDKLLKKGFARRLRSDDDRRIVKVSLTKTGEAAYHEHKKAHQNVTKYLLSILNAKERGELLRIMEKMAAHLRK